MQKPNSKKIPEVRYHPTIQSPAKKNQNKPQRGRPARESSPQVKVVQVDPLVSPGPSTQRALKKTNTGPLQGAATPPVRAPPPARAPPPDKSRPPATSPPPIRAPPPVKAPPSARVPPPVGALPPPEQVPLGLDVGLDRCVVEQVEALTRGQSSKDDWFSWRKNRITASMVHNVAHCKYVNGKSKAPPRGYLKIITEQREGRGGGPGAAEDVCLPEGETPGVKTRAMTWGIKMEPEAKRRYQELKSAALGRPVSVQDCGLFINPQRSWLAASPDGIVTDGSTGERLLCLEVKCPYKHRDRRVEDACREDRAFCLEIQEDGQSYRLKTSHSYYSQVQCQLAVTGLQEADFVVFTNEETAIVPVTFDPVRWKDTVSKLEKFYRDAVLPHIREKQQKAVEL